MNNYFNLPPVNTSGSFPNVSDDEEQENQYFREVLGSILTPTPRHGSTSQDKSHHRKATTLPKNDVRNTYAKALEDVLNSSDPAYVLHSFQQLLEPNCTFDAYFIHPKRNGETVETLDREVQGIEAIANQFVGCVVIIPDSLFLIHEWKIFLRPHNACCLVIKFSFSGSKVFDFSTPCIIRDYTNSSSSTTQHSAQNLDDTASDVTGEETIGHSVQFKGSSKTIKYDNRKRGKLFTIGEYVQHSETHSNHLADVSEEVMMEVDDDQMDTSSTMAASTIAGGGGIGDDARSQHSGGSDTTLHTINDGQGGQKGRMMESQTMNASGVMRFYINSNNKIAKIHCLRLPPLEHRINSPEYIYQ